MTEPLAPKSAPPSIPPPPTKEARDLIRYILGFGVGVAAGLALYLGKLRIPIFSPLLDLIPLDRQNVIIPLSSAVMGTVAVVVQWYAHDRLSTSWLKRLFHKTLRFLVVAFISLVVAHAITVRTVEIKGGEEAVAFQVGFVRPVKAPCGADVGDAECIERLTLDPAKIASFWGDMQVNLAGLWLIFSYLGLTGSFGVLVGALLLRQRLQGRQS
jgi:hypothetical protein